MNNPQIFCYKEVFLSYIACNERQQIFAFASLQKYFFNIQWHKRKH